MTGVVVVGAGPAGSVAALVLARHGVHVRLIDRGDFPRHKLCGDTLNPGALSILDRLGLGDRVRARSLPIPGMVVTGPHGTRVACDYPANLAGAAIARRDLDSSLLDAAIAAGVDFIPALPVRGALTERGLRVTGVRVGGRERDMPARVVIAADGRRSRLGFGLGLTRFANAPRRWAFGAYFTDVDGLTAYGEMHVRAYGYTGVAQLGSGVANVCVVRELRAGSGRIAPDQVIARALAGDPALQERFARARQISKIVSLGPLAVEARAAGCPGLLLAGDAAGFVDPMTGDGLRFALRGGELAAEAALFELHTGMPAHRRLEEARQREFASKWRVNRALRALVASPRSVRIAAAVSSCWGLPVRYLIGVAGDVPLASCRFREPLRLAPR
jgi:flavin-dependent dehydrogenase